VDHSPLCPFVLWDLPGDEYDETALLADGNESSSNNNNSNSYNHTSSSSSFAAPTALIFVVDAQDEPYDHVLPSITNAVSSVLRGSAQNNNNNNVFVEVFIHKVDGELFLSDESKYDCRRDVMTQITDELSHVAATTGQEWLENVNIRYHLTSIYDFSLYEAFSRVIQRLIAPRLPTLENLLNLLVSTCSMEKVYLLDVVSKLYIATDSGPVDMQSVELCSDMIDVVMDVSGIYGLGGPPPAAAAANNNKQQQSSSNGVLSASLANDGGSEKSSSDTTPDVDSAYDTDSACVIRLSNGMVLYLKEVDTMLALVCITRSENFGKKSLINYNINCFKKALSALVVKPNQQQQQWNEGQ
jgi:Ras-related GTP-binding protein C/D